MHKGRKYIGKLPILARSGFEPKHGEIADAKRSQYYIVTDIAISGDAPKDFIRYYQYGLSRKNNDKNWPLYIAKHGEKHYPMETITEYLLNRIGEVYGFNIAESDIVRFSSQVRFLSKYFLNNSNEQVLEHGADLYAGYLNDRNFVEEIEQERKSPEFFTIQFTEETLRFFFPNDYDELYIDFLKLLIFDALVGNNDRHFYNWGIITNISKDVKPVFSPIYDTARGLFWNYDEDFINEKVSNETVLHQFVKSYAKRSSPKIGWENCVKLTHFELIKNISTLAVVHNIDLIKKIFQQNRISNVLSMIDNEFRLLLSPNRKTLIKKYLEYRFLELKKILLISHHE